MFSPMPKKPKSPIPIEQIDAVIRTARGQIAADDPFCSRRPSVLGAAVFLARLVAARHITIVNRLDRLHVA
jgi:hypothetical protein